MEEKKDYLDRTPFLEDLMLLVNSISRRRIGCTFAIDGKWGCGKSFLLNMFEEEAKITQSEATSDDRYFIVRYDCWKYDYYSEPIVAIVAAIADQVEKTSSLLGNGKKAVAVQGAVKKLRQYLEECGGKLLESRLGFDPISLYRECEETGAEIKENKNSYNTYSTLTEVLDSLRTQLEKISQEKTIILVVDELDRCLPEYAIKVMESLHHIFHEIPNFITILAIDRKELKKVVRKAYGKKIKASAYLRKILDFYIVLGIGNLSETYLEKYSGYIRKFCGAADDLAWIQQMVFWLMGGLDIRTQEKIMARVELIHDMIETESVDYSCMAFEILFLRLQNANGRAPGLQYFQTTDKYSTGLNSCIKTITDDSNLNRSIVRDGKEYWCLEPDILCRLKWYIENIFEEENGGCCGKYYFKDYEKYRATVRKLKLFTHLAQLIE